jgi:hypothetical protein
MAQLSKLDAVNIILDALGETAVSSLNSGLADAEKAERVLDEQTTDVLEEGWHCNTDFNLQLVPDINGNIGLPNGTLRIDTSGTSADVDAVERDGKLYDREHQTSIFTKPVYVDITYDLGFETLPYRLRKYIAHKAARVYQERTLGSVQLDSPLRADEQDAHAKWLSADEESSDSNVLRDSDSVRRIAYRNNSNFGR